MRVHFVICLMLSLNLVLASENKPREKRTIHFLLLQFADALGYTLQPKPIALPGAVGTDFRALPPNAGARPAAELPAEAPRAAPAAPRPAAAAAAPARPPVPPRPAAAPRPAAPPPPPPRPATPPKQAEPKATPPLARFNFIVAPIAKMSGPRTLQIPLPEDLPLSKQPAPNARPVEAIAPQPRPAPAPRRPAPANPGPSKISIPLTAAPRTTIPPSELEIQSSLPQMEEITTIEAETGAPEPKADINGENASEEQQEFPSFNGDFPQYWGSGVIMPRPGQAYSNFPEEFGQYSNGVEDNDDYQSNFYSEFSDPQRPVRAPLTQKLQLGSGSSHSSVKMHDSDFNYVTYHGGKSASNQELQRGPSKEFFGKHSILIRQK